MTIALLLFALAAIGGIALATLRIIKKSNPPMGLALAHGLGAAAGLVALIVVVRQAASLPQATTALVLLLVAAGGGFVLFFNHLRKVTLPVWLVVVHALVAVVGFATLLIAAAS